MATEKYYTPTIEEFHVGFEYEEGSYSPAGQLLAATQAIQPPTVSMRNPVYKTTPPDLWRRCSVEEDFATPPIIHGIDSKTIRVKYLDEEDILAEGWVKTKRIRPNGDSYLIHDEKGYAPMYLFKESENWVMEVDRNEYIGKVFRGTIRNRSELRQIMKMVGIK